MLNDTFIYYHVPCILRRTRRGDRIMTDNTTQHKTDATAFTEDELKMIALAKHLDIDTEDIDQSGYDDTIFEADGEEYLVCTDDDADERAGDYIKESLWAFNPGFIIDHSELPYDAIEMIEGVCDSKYEDANNTIHALITDMDEFIEDAICSDGRGHFLNHYDGYEYEEGGFYIYQI